MADSIEKLVQIDMSHFSAYSPCKDPEVMAQKLGLQAEQILKLDANENPYGCSPRVRQALAQYPYFNIYPDAAQTELRGQLAQYTGLGPDYLVAGSGSDELIDLLIRLFVAPGDEVIINVPTFDMYRFCTQVCRGKVVEVLRKKDFTVNIGAVKKAITARTRLIFITSPNNPTGTCISERDILSLLETGIPLVIDEAYYEFSRQTVVNLVPRYQKLIVLRTFSKWAGLAGLRVGYGVFTRALTDILIKIKPPYNINSAALVAVRESLKDREYLLGTVAKMIQERGRLMELLKSIEFLRPVPSEANFILCEVVGFKAISLQEELEKQGILVRYYNTSLLSNYIRISVGKVEQTDRVVGALRQMPEKLAGKTIR